MVTSDESKGHAAGPGTPARRGWAPMRLTDAGNVYDVVLGGGGKVSIQAHDGGDTPYCPKGQESHGNCLVP